MNAEYNRKSLLWGAPGIVIQTAGIFISRPIGSAVQLIGTILLLVGLAFYAKSKGRNPAWCLMAFVGLIGLIVLGLLTDKARAPNPPKV